MKSGMTFLAQSLRSQFALSLAALRSGFRQAIIVAAPDGTSYTFAVRRRAAKKRHFPAALF